MLTLYAHPFSTPALAALFTGHATGAKFETKIIDLTKHGHREPEFLAINPHGKVPALKDGDFTMSESTAIMRYLARTTQSSLLPMDPKGAAVVDQWMDFIAHHIRTPFSHVQFGRMFAPLFKQEPNEAAIQNGVDQLQNNLPYIEARLGAHEYICGNALTLADILFTATLDPTKAINLDLSLYPAVSAMLNKTRKSDWYLAVHTHYAAEMGLNA